MIKRYLNYTGETAPTASLDDVLNYIGYLRKEELHPKSLINNLFSIKIYYRWLIATGQREDHPCQRLTLKDKVNKRIPVESLYSKEVLEELLKHHKSTRARTQRRNEVVISLLIYQAMTVQEITTLDLEDVNLKEATIKPKGGRKQKPRTLNLQAAQILLLHQYMKEDRKKLLKYSKRFTQDDERALILGDNGARIYANTINVIVNTGRKKHERLRPIKIRQSVIAHLLKQNNDLRIVQVFAGHKRAGSTEEYKQTGLEELKTIIQNLHPLETMGRDRVRK